MRAVVISAGESLMKVGIVMAVAMLSITMVYQSVSYVKQTSKIEEGVIVQRNDSVITVIIPDGR